MSKTRLLIANRGEIAIRIARTAREMGYLCVGIARQKDADDLYLSSMDEIAFFEKDTVQETFLSEEAILILCKKYNIQVVHPGYGFLSESASFARKLKKAGVHFLGPTPSSLEQLGNKVSAKKLAEECGIPVIPGYRGELFTTKGNTLDTKAKQEIEKIGFPALVKSGAGGGGRGMRIVMEEGELQNALIASNTEALRAFGDGTLFIEKYIEPARHIEIQVCGDLAGAVIHLYERDCSLQRRFQKILEVAPAEGIPLQILEEMRESAIALARSAKLSSLATIEFLYDPIGRKYYFMECNPRLQVEHTITEEITGIDLVALQLNVAEGKKLPAQTDIRIQGVAIQARICAEVPEEDGRPVKGKIRFHDISNEIRVDTGVQEDSVVHNDFDSMLAKIIVRAETFQDARLKLVKTLRTMKFAGVPLSSGFLVQLLEAMPSFSETYTSSVASFLNSFKKEAHEEALYSLASFFYSYYYSGIVQHSSDVKNSAGRAEVDAFGARNAFDSYLGLNPFSKGIRPREFQYLPLLEIKIPQYESRKKVLTPAYLPFSKEYAIIRSGEDYFKTFADGKEGGILLLEAGRDSRQEIEILIDAYHVIISPAQPETNEETTQAGSGDLQSPLPGTVTSVYVKVGDYVSKGDRILSFDSMKTEHVLSASGTGIIEKIEVLVGDSIERGQILVHIVSDVS